MAVALDARHNEQVVAIAIVKHHQRRVENWRRWHDHCSRMTPEDRRAEVLRSLVMAGHPEDRAEGMVDRVLLQMEQNAEQYRLMESRRCGQLRRACRQIHLARMFLRGKPYEMAEPRVSEGNWPDFKMVLSYVVGVSQQDSRVLLQRFAAWEELGRQNTKVVPSKRRDKCPSP